MSKSLAWIGTRAATSLFLASSPCARNPISSGLGSLYLRRPASPLVLKCSMSDTPKTAVDFRVVTYNILCSHLAEPTRFPLCDPENLDAPTRLIRVKQKLDTEVSKGAVICMQEVGLQWAGDLHVYFMARGYAFVTAHYGKHFNNYMGVALAWPLDKYEALTVDTTRVAETREWGRDPREASEERPASPSQTSGVKRPREANSSSDKNRGEPEEENPWKIAERRFNQALFARLRPKGSSSAPSGGTFCVGTYHMPCLFNIRPVMVIHTSLVIKHLAGLAGSDPLVFAGDFNFNPDSECYKLAVEGDLPSSSLDFPVRPEWEKDWVPSTGVKLTSAYKQVEGKEPNFTNNAKVEDYAPFIDTLDYVFHTPGITAVEALHLKHRDEVKGPFPTAEEPSDHVVLAAGYKFNRPTTD
eukprot:jgi/Undpi1/485/HiC_scaffold_10.g03951.m1